MSESHDVEEYLGSREVYGEWIAELNKVGPPQRPIHIPEPDAVSKLLKSLGASDAAIADALATIPDRKHSPEIWWLLERCFQRLVRDMGRPDAERGLWPLLPEETGAAGRCFYIHLFLAVLPVTRQWHRRVGVPDEISWSTLADLGRHIAMHQDLFGAPGIDLPWWMTLHLRGIIFELGRLQYTRFRFCDSPEHPDPWLDEATAQELGAGFQKGDATLGIHIPGGSPLLAEQCRTSLRQARDFFDKYFPEPTLRVATCSSWLLDDQLAEYLPPDSNILAFQRLFRLVPGWRDRDDQILNFVFRRRNIVLDELQPTTTLERAVVEHLKAGRHWRWRTGWLPLP